MKLHYKYLMATGLFLIVNLAMAQVNTVKESSVLIESNVTPGFSVTLEPDDKTVKKSWKDFMRDTYNIDVEGVGLLSNKDVVTSSKVVIPSVSPKPIDVLFKGVESGSLTKVELVARFDRNNYIDPQRNNAEYQALKLLFTKFLKGFLVDYYNDIVEDSKDEVQNLEKDIAKMKEDVEDNELKIVELRNEASSLENENREKALEIENLDSKLKSTRERFSNKKEMLGEIRTEL